MFPLKCIVVSPLFLFCSWLFNDILKCCWFIWIYFAKSYFKRFARRSLNNKESMLYGSITTSKIYNLKYVYILFQSVLLNVWHRKETNTNFMFIKQMEKILQTLRPPKLWVPYALLKMLIFDVYTMLHWNIYAYCSVGNLSTLKNYALWNFFFQSALNQGPNQPTLKRN